MKMKSNATLPNFDHDCFQNDFVQPTRWESFANLISSLSMFDVSPMLMLLLDESVTSSSKVHLDLMETFGTFKHSKSVDETIKESKRHVVFASMSSAPRGDMSIPLKRC